MECWVEFIPFLPLLPDAHTGFDAWAMVYEDRNQVSPCCPSHTETTVSIIHFFPLSTFKLTCRFPLPRAHQEQSADSSEIAYVGKAVNKVHVLFSRATSSDQSRSQEQLSCLISHTQLKLQAQARHKAAGQ